MAAVNVQPRKKRARRGVRYQMELSFDAEDAKQAFLSKLDNAKRYLARSARCTGSLLADNTQLFSLLLDKLDLEVASTAHTDDAEVDSQERTQLKRVTPVLENSGLFSCTCDYKITIYNIIQVYLLVMMMKARVVCSFVSQRPLIA